MIVIGITGPSGAGKSDVSKMFSEYGFDVIDADAVYHRITSSPSECTSELAANFGNKILNCDGSLNRAELANMVFGEEKGASLMLLNNITHKYVVKVILSELSSLRLTNSVGCIIDAPLLFEAELDRYCDVTLAVLADESIRASRISCRDGITRENAIRRIFSQKVDDFYKEKADNVIYNNGTRSEIKEYVIKFLSERGIICENE